MAENDDTQIEEKAEYKPGDLITLTDEQAERLRVHSDRLTGYRILIQDIGVMMKTSNENLFQDINNMFPELEPFQVVHDGKKGTIRIIGYDEKWLKEKWEYEEKSISD